MKMGLCFKFEDKMESTINEAEKIEQMLGIIMAQQHNLKAGLKYSGLKREHSVPSETTQLYDMDMLSTIDDRKIPEKESEESLVSQMFLK